MDLMIAIYCIVLIQWLASVVLGGIVGDANRRPGLGAFCGLLFGPLGILIAAVLPASVATEAPRRTNTATLKTSPPVAETAGWLDRLR
jgi:hypothetical protein